MSTSAAPASAGAAAHWILIEAANPQFPHVVIGPFVGAAAADLHLTHSAQVDAFCDEDALDAFVAGFRGRDAAIRAWDAAGEQWISVPPQPRPCSRYRVNPDRIEALRDSGIASPGEIGDMLDGPGPVFACDDGGWPADVLLQSAIAVGAVVGPAGTSLFLDHRRDFDGDVSYAFRLHIDGAGGGLPALMLTSYDCEYPRFGQRPGDAGRTVVATFLACAAAEANDLLDALDAHRAAADLAADPLLARDQPASGDDPAPARTPGHRP